MSPAEIQKLWAFFPVGLLLTIAVELPIVWFGLSAPRSKRDRLIAGIGLTAFTYPIVVLVLPIAMQQYEEWQYTLVAEGFAHLGECALFYLAFRGQPGVTTRDWLRDFAAILIANGVSYGGGEAFRTLFPGVI